MTGSDGISSVCAHNYDGDRFSGSKSPSLNPRRDPSPGRYVDKSGAFGGEGLELPVGVRPFEAAPLPVLEFSDISDPSRIRTLCKEHVPGWNCVPFEKIVIDQICEGLSNQLFKVHLEDGDERKGLVPCVLFRCYGKDVATLYDSDLEVRIFKLLSGYQIAPKMYGNGDGWRIEEWHFSVPLPTTSMRNPSIFCQVASQLGRFHKLSSRHDFPRDILQMPPVSMTRVQTWLDECKQAAAQFRDSESKRRVSELCIDDIVAEQEWLKEFVVADNEKIRGAGLDKVFCHLDPQENNILQTHYGLRFIDFEYSCMDYQAFDMASYFVECTINYTEKSYPFYKVSLSDYPSEAERRRFYSIYLSEYMESIVDVDDDLVSLLSARVDRFVLLTHFLWTVWSVIRSPQAPTFGEFDFLHYAQTRWDMYKRDKRALLSVIEKDSPCAAAHKAVIFSPAVSPFKGSNKRTEDESTSAESNSNAEPVAPTKERDANTRLQKTPFFIGAGLASAGILLGMGSALVGMRLLK